MSTMKFRTHIALFLVGLFLAASLPLSARNNNKYNTNRYSKPRIVWGAKQNRNTGLYSMRNSFVSHGVTLNVSALYFFGDVDNEGRAAVTFVPLEIPQRIPSSRIRRREVSRASSSVTI